MISHQYFAFPQKFLTYLFFWVQIMKKCKGISNISVFRRDHSPCNIFKRGGFQLAHVSQKHLNTQMSYSTSACSKQGWQLIQTQYALFTWVLRICKEKNPGSSLGLTHLITFEANIFFLRIFHTWSSSVLSCQSLPSLSYCKVNILH